MRFLVPVRPGCLHARMTAPARQPLLLRDLFADPATGRLSHTRVWSNVGYALATVLFAKVGWTAEASAEIWLIYLGAVGSSAAVSKALSLRYRQGGDAYGYPPIDDNYGRDGRGRD